MEIRTNQLVRLERLYIGDQLLFCPLHFRPQIVYLGKNRKSLRMLPRDELVFCRSKAQDVHFVVSAS